VVVPAIVKEPVVILMISFLVEVVADIVNVVPIVIVPAFTFIVVVNPAFGRGITTAPETVRVLVPLIVKAVVPVEANVIDVQAAAAVTVTVIPAFIVTASPSTGTDSPPHVAVEFQLPVTDAVLAARVPSLGVSVIWGLSLISVTTSGEEVTFVKSSLSL
jgi:hypothetical protein